MIVLKRDYPFGSFIDPFTTLSRKQPAKLPLWCAVFTKRPFSNQTEPLRIGKEFAKAQSGRWMEVCDLSTLYLFFVFVFVCFFLKVDIWWFIIIYSFGTCCSFNISIYFPIFFIICILQLWGAAREQLQAAEARVASAELMTQGLQVSRGTTAETASHLLNVDVVRYIYTQVFATEIHRNSYGCCTFAVKLWLVWKGDPSFWRVAWHVLRVQPIQAEHAPRPRLPMGVPEAGVPTDTNGLSFRPTKIRFFKWTTIWRNCL